MLINFLPFLFFDSISLLGIDIIAKLWPIPAHSSFSLLFNEKLLPDGVMSFKREKKSRNRAGAPQSPKLIENPFEGDDRGCE